MTSVFTVILNWNRKQDTLECIKSVQKLHSPSISNTIILVDNASTDGTIEAIHDQSIVILKNEENMGFAQGNNVGIDYALLKGADYVLVLNNDTIVERNLLKELVNVAEKNSKDGILSPKIYFAPGYEFHKKRYKPQQKGKVLWYAGGEIDWDNVYGANRGVDEVDVGQHDQVREIDFATGACMLIRADALKKVGTFNKLYYMYLEDAELSIRFKKEGWFVRFVPTAVLWHKVGQSSSIGSNLNDYYLSRNRMLFGMSYAPLRAKIALVRESIRLILSGRKWQKQGIIDFYTCKFGKGSWQ